jgi:hypothetical protein
MRQIAKLRIRCSIVIKTTKISKITVSRLAIFNGKFIMFRFRQRFLGQTN